MQIRLLLVTVCFAFLVGCSGSEDARVKYNSKKNLTTYEAGTYTVSSVRSANLAGSKSIDLRFIGQCSGTNCSPDAVRFVFSASGNREMRMSGVDGRIVADETRITWTGAEVAMGSWFKPDNEMVRVSGKFAEVELPVEQVKRIAQAKSVKGSIGGINLDFGPSVQTGLQNLLQKMSHGSAGPDGASDTG